MVTTRDRHGGNILAAARALGISPAHVLDFSASVNPLGPSPRALRALAQARRAVVHYPDPDCVELREALAQRHGIGLERILVGNGSSELIHLLPHSLPIEHAVIVGPTFSEYERALRGYSTRITRLQAGRSRGYGPPLEEAARTLGRLGRHQSRSALFLCNPNSPTGQAIERGALRDLVRLAARRKVLTVLDETFVDYCDHRSLLPEAGTHPRLLVLRSFTKFYGLAGLRIGYLVGAAPLLARLEARRPPWSVNALAQAAARAALTDVRHARRSLACVSRERAYLAGRLGALGLTVYPSAANFLMVECPHPWSAPALTGTLRARGVLVRDLSAVPGLTRRTIRVAVRPHHENRRLLADLASILSRRRR